MSEVLATVLLTATTMILVGGFGATVLATVANETTSPSASFSVQAEAGDASLTARLVSGSTLDLSATRIHAFVNDTDLTASHPTSGSWAPGQDVVVQLTAPIPHDARVTVFVIDADANQAVGRTTRTILTASTLPAYVGNAMTATAQVEPVPVTADGRMLANLTVAVEATFGRDLVTAVTANLTRVGGVGDAPLRDDGQGADEVAGDGVWSGQFTASSYDFLTSTERERIQLPVRVRDVLGGATTATADLWLKPAPLSKVVAGAIFRSIPSSDAIAYLNFTNFTFRDVTLLENDVIELRVSDLQDTTRSWTALVRLTDEDPDCPGEPTIASVTLTRDGTAGNATLAPTGCFVIGSGASLNLVTFSSSWDNAQPPNAVSWTGDAAGYSFLDAGIGEPNEAIVTFMGDATSFGTSMTGIGQANLTWGREAPATNATGPGAPTLHAPTSGNGTVTLSWSAPSSDGGSPITGYRIYAGTTSGALTLLDAIGTNRSYVVAGLANGQTYYFHVVAVNAAGEGDPSAERSAAPAAAPGVPGDFEVAAGDGYVLLSWSAPADDGGFPLSNYKVYRGTTNGTFSLLGSTAGLTFNDTTAVNGTRYYYRVAATTSAAEGSPTATKDALPSGDPDAPASLTATRGNRTVTLSWPAPASNGEPVTAYKVYRGTASGATAYLATVATTTYLDAGLTNGQAYYYNVTAVNAVGEGPTSPEATATPGAPPDPPGGFGATAGNAQVTLSWDVPADNGYPISGYRVYRGTTSGATTLIATTTNPSNTSFVVNGLANGVTYYFNVTAVNALGPSASSGEVSATPTLGATVPGAPQSFQVAAASGSADLSWAAPASDGGSPLLTYRIHRGTSPGSLSQIDEVLAGQTSYASTGLTNGVTYYFAVSATNVVGEGAKTSTLSTVPATAPSAPTSLDGTAGNRSVSLSWSAPADNGASLTGYTVYYGTTSPPTTNFTFTTSLAATVTGLTNGQQYYFAVSASNAMGESAKSAAIARTPLAVPDPPSGLAATGGNRSVSLSWSAPSDTGGASIAGYTVYYGTTSPPTTNFTFTTSLGATVTGLANGQLYYFAVSASNPVGEGSQSGAASATPLAAPNPPSGLAVTGTGNRTVSLSWSAPADNGGATVTGYTVYYGTTSPPTSVFTTTSSLSATVTGLNNGQLYHFAVSATNPVGEGSRSASVSGTPLAVPDPPSGLAVTGTGNRTISVSWSAPSDTGGTSITGYTVYYGTTNPPLGNFTFTSATSATITGLTNGQQYFVAVSASNAAGPGSKSASVSGTPLAVPNPPGGLAATAGNRSVSLSWSAPADNGGAAVTGYNVYYGTTSTPTTLWGTTASLSATVTGLTNGQQYHFAVSATNSVGEGSKGASVAATPLTVPNPPSALAVTGTGNRTVSLSWSAPSDTGGATVTGYNVYYGTTSPPAILFATTAGTTSTVTGLTNGQLYHFAVSATTSAGEGSKTGSVTATPLAVPNPPGGLAATAGSTQVSLSWSAPSDTGGATVTGYKVYYGTTSPPTTLWTTTTSLASTVTGLTNGQIYHFAVSATNSVGEGSKSASVSATPVMAGSAPGAPIGLQASPANNQVGLNWSAPSSDGGSAITGYKVYRGASSGSLTLLATIGTNATFTDRTAVNGVTYYYAVRAVNAVGDGAQSDVVSATPNAAVSFDCGNVTQTSGLIGAGGCSALQFADLTYATLDESGSGSAKSINMTFTYNLTGVTGTATLEMNGYMGKNNEALHLQARASNGTFVTITTLPISVGSTPTTVSGTLDAATYWPTGRLSIRLIDDAADPASSSWNIDYVRMVTT